MAVERPQIPFTPGLSEGMFRTFSFRLRPDTDGPVAADRAVHPVLLLNSGPRCSREVDRLGPLYASPSENDCDLACHFPGVPSLTVEFAPKHLVSLRFDLRGTYHSQVSLTLKLSRDGMERSLGR
jgi:hypothetical protein